MRSFTPQDILFLKTAYIRDVGVDSECTNPDQVYVLKREMEVCLKHLWDAEERIAFLKEQNDQLEREVLSGKFWRLLSCVSILAVVCLLGWIIYVH